ncbi:MFS transporter [Streptomyces sp. SL13]|uniref:MFS transporter n=1 Tax=Streptantibioticus silvisoli TaxID=2705255 RepID=A0AA90H7J0_9ACTN|nr:MFS transporter [Streptantibioticus silvisoli]MDI5973356.1 MFS transporter [Streptantibioticus silvisoli]
MTTATGRSAESGFFRLMWAGQTVSVIGDGAALLAVPLLMLRITGSPLLSALAATPRTIAYLLVGLLAGPLADRWNSRRVLIWCDVARGLVFAAMPLTVGLPGGAGLLLVMACLAAAIGVLFETSMTKAVQSLLRPDALLKGNARLELSNQLGILLGPALIGGFMAWVGVRDAIWLNAATFAASVGTLLPLRGLAGPAGARLAAKAEGLGAAALWREMREGMGYLRAHPLISRLVTVQAAVNFVIAAETLVIFHATKGLHASPAWAGAVVAAAGVGGVLAAAVVGRVAPRASPARLIGWSVIGLGGSLLGFALSVDPLMLLVANLLHGGLSIFASVQIRSLRQKLVPLELLGRVTANARTLAFVANPVGAALFGAITAYAGGDARYGFGAAALFSVLSGVVAYRGLVSGAARAADRPEPEEDSGPPSVPLSSSR